MLLKEKRRERESINECLDLPGHSNDGDDEGIQHASYANPRFAITRLRVELASSRCTPRLTLTLSGDDDDEDDVEDHVQFVTIFLTRLNTRGRRPPSEVSIHRELSAAPSRFSTI